MLLLLWTAVDLSNAGLCALDNEDAAPMAADATATFSAAAHDAGAPLAPDTTRHVDDCFCCSHCVDIRALTVALDCTAVALPRALLMLAAPRNAGASLYHPPLTA